MAEIAQPLPEEALEEVFLAGTGPGGQNVNKVATAVQMRLDVYALRLSPVVYQRLKALAGSRWTNDGEIVITARSYRVRPTVPMPAHGWPTLLSRRTSCPPDG